MSANNSNSNNWQNVLDYKARILHTQIARLQREVAEHGGDEQLLDEMSRPYVELLKSIYAEDYPLAKAIAESDILFTLEGPAINRNSPRISIITNLFEKVKIQVKNVAKAVAQIGEMRATPDEMDLGLSAFAKGSLILGFTLPTSEEINESRPQPSFFDEEYYRAARTAIRTIGIVTSYVTEGRSFESLSEAIPDARVRDTALVAIKELAPSGRTGVDAVRITGREITDLELHNPLTPVLREVIRKRIQRPLSVDANRLTEPSVSLVGEVREMDLDVRRFDLRQIEKLEVKHVRCSYLDASDAEAILWMGKRVRVTGIVERDATGNVNMLEITEPVEVL